MYLCYTVSTVYSFMSKYCASEMTSITSTCKTTVELL